MSGVAEARKVEAIGLGGLSATDDASDELVCLGLGSCVAVCIYDGTSRVVGMVHLVLPSSLEGNDTGRSAKFVDTGVPLLVEEMEKLSALRSRMVVKIAGGAHMITAVNSNGTAIGDRNVIAVRQALASLGLPISAEEVGGNRGRTVRIFADSGRVLVSSAGSESREL